MKKVFVVTHTHWDREWYTTFEVYRQRLSILLNQLDSIFKMEDRFEHFHLDGQTVVLEDFVENDGMKEGFFELVRQGKIAVGPWYVLPDEFLISGESFIRNYLYSQQIAKKFNVPLSRVAYLPDMFGHNAYTPTILRGLGMEWAVVWRGVDDVKGTSFVWSSPTGESIDTVYLVHSYSNAAHWGWDEERFKLQLCSEAKALIDIDSENEPLLMNGTDHEIPRPDVGRILKEISNEEMKFVHASLEEYVSQLKKPRESLTGELRSPKRAPILKDVLSARIWEKLMQYEAERLYLHYVEPLFATAKLSGIDLPLESLWHGWKLILQCHPHDSLCGCSVDEVHKNVQDRLTRAINHGKAILVRALLEVCGKPVDKMGLTLFNPLESEHDGMIELNVRLPEGEWKLVSQDGRPVECVLFPTEDVQQDLNMLIDFYSQPSTIDVFKDQGRWYKCFLKTSVQALSFKQLSFVQGERQKTGAFESIFAIQENGTLRVEHGGKSLENLCYVEDVEDVGDEYNYSYVCKDKYDSKNCTAEIETLIDSNFFKRVEARFSLEVPAQIAADRKSRSRQTVSIPFRFVYTFHRDTKRVDVDVFFNNTAKDHRLSVVFPLEGLSELISDGYFGPVKRSIQKLEGDYSSWSELPENQFPTYWFVSVPQYRMTIIPKGLREVFVDENGLHLTILRSVGWLSRDDLITRPGHAGPGFETPGAQGLGTHRVSFSIVFHDEYDITEIYKAARECVISPLAFQARFERLPRIDVDIERGFLSAFKPTDEGVILRLFCPDGSKPSMKTVRHATEVDLAEKPLSERTKIKHVRSWMLR
ncbi:MAG: Glycoside hydrolase family 38 [Thermotoga sp. 50_1627]|uniref:glycoside hydrolase family 38 N-terminal domain-containing protein n=1 Tax=Pseudothermotoga sp. TaxID=2033661 RepID=UPI00076C6020|nr:MAG: Glycoside hydrolase family 38 [Thermotoga sp. 50_64]KUK24975.1 MAG: Glycoside hydrolase family 38 [Thermotoga sp. 50_1627]MBC7115972.1 hypothetical protein [Pseudothermotoga sp.]HBT39163.1 hypothetical protein [Pseudothermotoga sp.]HCO97504.1 hypothetical protein [Pseudothermotoga sp.]